MLLRHGQSNLAVAEVGVPLQDALKGGSLVSLMAGAVVCTCTGEKLSDPICPAARSDGPPGFHQVGFVLEPFDVEPQSGSEAAVRAFEQLRAELSASDLAPRMALHYATSRCHRALWCHVARSAAEALPDRALDVVLLDLRGSSASVAQVPRALFRGRARSTWPFGSPK